MKIYGSQPPDGQEISRVSQNIAKNIGNSESKDKIVPAPPQVQKDKVEISSTGKEVADLMATINQMPGVREDKIKAVQDTLAAGTYTIDPRKIAEKILQEL
jgi:negative regulator of flagellin synthesis FlgM